MALIKPRVTKRLRMKVKTRKDHICGFCDKVIKKGQHAEFEKGRSAKLGDDHETQIGIQYWSVYLHTHDCHIPEDDHAELPCEGRIVELGYEIGMND